MGQVLGIEEMRQRLCDARESGKKIVFTNGVFDLLHAGHVRYLQAARNLGAMLILGLNSDASARRLKGPGRPIVSQSDRAQVLCALYCVDYVVIFDEPTAERLIEALRPDIYVKGGDYQLGPRQGQCAEVAATAPAGKALPEAITVQGYGGQVVLLPYLPGHSTTELIRRVCAMCGGVR